MKLEPRSHFDDLVAMIHEAALDARIWPDFATRAGEAFGGAQVRLGVIDRRGEPLFEAAAPGIANADLFFERYMTPQTNPGLAFVVATPPLTVDLRERQVSDRDLVKLDFYNDIMRPEGLWHAINVNVHRDERYLAPMGIVRTRSRGAFTDAEVGMARRLAPHLNRAIRVSLRLREMEARAEAVGDLNDRANVGLVLTDPLGRVAHVNRLARAILDEADGLKVRDGALHAARAEDNVRLTRLIYEAAGGAASSRLLRPSGVMHATRPSLRRPLPLVVSPTRNAGSMFGLSHSVCVAFADPERASELDADLLARLYRLTRREAAVAVRLMQGKSPAEIAATLAMTMNTLRTHIRHIFEKTGVDRLSELMRLLLGGLGVGVR